MGYSLWLNSCICLCLKRGNSKSTLDSSCYLLKSRAFEGLPGLPHFQSHSNQMILQETAMQSGTRESEKRVAATPASIKMLQNEGYKVGVCLVFCSHRQHLLLLAPAPPCPSRCAWACCSLLPVPYSLLPSTVHKHESGHQLFPHTPVP